MKKLRKRKNTETVMAFDFLKLSKEVDFLGGEWMDLPKGNSSWIGMKVEDIIGNALPIGNAKITEVWETNKACEPQDTHILPSSEDKGYCGNDAYIYGSTYPLE